MAPKLTGFAGMSPLRPPGPLDLFDTVAYHSSNTSLTH